VLPVKQKQYDVPELLCSLVMEQARKHGQLKLKEMLQ